MTNLKQKKWWFRIYIFLILLVSLAFISLNILAEVEETPTDLKNFLKNEGCPKLADVTELTFKDACTGLVWARNELPTFNEANDPNPGYSWQEAETACATLAPAGLFRLPTVEESLTLINYVCTGTTCKAKSNIAMVKNNDPAFANGIYWTSSDFNEPETDTNVNANPPGNAGRDYKRSVNLLTGVVDSPVFGQDMRLNAWCVVERNPGVVEKKFTATTASGNQVTGGTLKTIYHRECVDASECSLIGATACEPRTIYAPGCGNLILDFGEECDGNEGTAATPAESSASKQYSCTPNCYSTGGWCGDNTLQAGNGEQCDSSVNIAITPGDSSISKQYDCTDDCQFTGGYCGDNTVQASKGEECDDGNRIDTDACDNTCHHYCGDGTVQASNGEQCDDGNRINSDACDNACKWTIVEIIPITLDQDVTKLEVSGDGVVYDTNSNYASAADANYNCDPVSNVCETTGQSCTNNSDCPGTYLKLAKVMPTPYIWIANSTTNTITKIRAFDGYKRKCDRSGGEVTCSWDTGVWETKYKQFGPYSVNGTNPSRTAVNVETGDVWVANRDSGSITKLDIDGNIKKTCCTTDPCNASAGPRGVAIEEDGDVWVGNYGVYAVWAPGSVNRISSDDTDCTIKQTVSVGGYPYGLAIDSNGNIWVSNAWYAGGIQKINLKANPTNPTVDMHLAPHNYGITVDKDDNVWGGSWGGLNSAGASQYTVPGFYRVAANASSTSAADHIPGPYNTTGITVDLAGNIWASAYNDNKVVKCVFDSVSKICALNSYDQLATAGHSNPHGIVGDSNGYIWSVQVLGNTARVFSSSGSAGPDIQVNPAAYSQNYTYSDMSGLNRALQLRSGIWLAKFDGNNINQHWGNLSWQQTVPGSKQSVEVLIRASNNLDFSGAAW
ncbi:MAG: DUF4215 domain-containing protein, partial [Candidatus Parcubacteria bacterium]|nr:DUF4215 domain-containing protein [Candidatus Parcubacteria bacterium]